MKQTLQSIDRAMEKDAARKYILAGWVLFILSSILFIVSAVRNGDWIGLGGSLCFSWQTSFF